MGSASSSATNPFESSVTETFAGTLESKVVSFAPKRRFSSVSESPLTLFFSPSARVVTASFSASDASVARSVISPSSFSKSLLTRIGSQNGFCRNVGAVENAAVGAVRQRKRDKVEITFGVFDGKPQAFEFFVCRQAAEHSRKALQGIRRKTSSEDLRRE